MAIAKIETSDNVVNIHAFFRIDTNKPNWEKKIKNAPQINNKPNASQYNP